MISDKEQKKLLEKIKNVEAKIQEIYYIEEFDVADQFNRMLSNIKDDLLRENIGFDFIDSDKSTFDEFEQKMESLEAEISTFLQEKSKDILENEIANDDETNNKQHKTTEELWNDLKNIKDNLEQGDFSFIQQQEYNRKIAKSALKILIEQAKRGEEIGVYKVQQYCNLENFLFAIKERLIDTAQKEDKKGRRNTLKMAKKLNLTNINDAKLWQKLTNIEDVKVSFMGGEKPRESYALTVVNPKSTLMQSIKRKLRKNDIPKTTVYTLGDLNQETLEWENIEIIQDKFPRKFSKKETRRVLAIEINDVPRVTQEHGLGKYPNLQTVTFGRNVKSIGSFVLSYYEDKNYINELLDLSKLEELDYKSIIMKMKMPGKVRYNSLVKEIKISDSVVKLEEYAFEDLPELQKIKFGNGISKIPNYCCLRCDYLKGIEFSDNLREIGDLAFMQNRSYQVVEGMWVSDLKAILNLRAKILEKYSNKYNNLNGVEIPKSVEKIGNGAFEFSERKPVVNRIRGKEDAYSLVLTSEQEELFGKDIAGNRHIIRKNKPNSYPIKTIESKEKVNIIKQQDKSTDDADDNNEFLRR